MPFLVETKAGTSGMSAAEEKGYTAAVVRIEPVCRVNKREGQSASSPRMPPRLDLG